MRNVILCVLLASAATAPAVGQRADPDDRQQARAERQQAREDRQVREERQVREARQAREERQVREPRVEQVERRMIEAPVRVEARAVGRADRRDIEQIRAARRQADDARERRGDNRQQRLETWQQNRQLRQAERARPPVLRDRAPVVSPVPQPNTQPPARAERRQYTPYRWSSDWRRNSRYNWYDYRNRYRSQFRLGFYNDPFGWGYQPYSIGWRMWPSYYRSSYWLNDPWHYRLPYAPAGTRWIRYYDDAILVDTWDGQVVDVIYNFFW